MADFVNTIDLLGDEVVAKSLIDRTITEFHDDVVTKVGNYAFYNCSKLTSVNFPLVTSVGSSAFYGCSALTSVDLPNVTAIETDVFNNCRSLTSVNIPNASTIKSYAFKGCSSLQSIDLPNATSISSTFQSCIALNTVILRRSTICTLGNKNAFDGTPFASGGTGGTLLVPSAQIAKYRSATNWSVILGYTNNRVLALENYTVDGTTTGAIDWEKLGGTA